MYRVRIEKFSLRVAGASAEEGLELGRDVARRLSGALAGDPKDRNLGALHLRVSIPAGTPRNRLAALIAEAISKGLR